MLSQNVSDGNKIVTCPVCEKKIKAIKINEHLDNACCDDGTLPRDTASDAPESSPHEHDAPKQGSIKKRFEKSDTSNRNIAPIFQTVYKQSASSASSSLSIPNDKTSVSSSTKKRPTHDPIATESMSPASKRSKVNKASSQAVLPLAERLRPRQLTEFVGQPHLLGSNSLLSMLLQSKSSDSLLLWGPPGCGKTTLARLICHATGSDAVFKELSSTNTGTSEIRGILEESKRVLMLSGRQTTLFLDEIHRFNKAQQDVFLPYVEQGHIRLIGATTENPSFKITAALLSRCRVLVLEPLNESEMMTILYNAMATVGSSQSSSSDATSHLDRWKAPEGIQDMQGSLQGTTDADSPSETFPHITPKVLSSIISLAMGDARKALSLLDVALKYPSNGDESALVNSLKRSVAVAYDRSGDSHYDMISALHKSVRGSNADAALYWLARMLNAGEDPLYIVRRMIVCASEDIGVADAHALPLAIATLQACQVIGMPECRINLAHLVVYLSEARKSTRAYEAYNRAEEAAKLDPSIPVPFQMRNAPTMLMKELGYGRDYAYNPAYTHPVHNTYLPIQIQGSKFLKKDDDVSDKIWDESALRHWELEVNGGRDWEGRMRRENSSRL